MRLNVFFDSRFFQNWNNRYLFSPFEKLQDFNGQVDCLASCLKSFQIIQVVVSGNHWLLTSKAVQRPCDRWRKVLRSSDLQRFSFDHLLLYKCLTRLLAGDFHELRKCYGWRVLEAIIKDRNSNDNNWSMLRSKSFERVD